MTLAEALTMGIATVMHVILISTLAACLLSWQLEPLKELAVNWTFGTICCLGIWSTEWLVGCADE